MIFFNESLSLLKVVKVVKSHEKCEEYKMWKKLQKCEKIIDEHFVIMSNIIDLRHHSTYIRRIVWIKPKQDLNTLKSYFVSRVNFN